MTAPDFQHGYLRVPLSLWSALYCRCPLTRRQLQLVSVVLRESWGWQGRDGQVRLWTRRLSAADFAAATGLSTDHLARDLRRLVARRVLDEREGRYQLEADPGLWITPGAAAPSAAGSAGSAVRAAEGAVEAAGSAPAAPGAKKEKIRNRNVPPDARGLSTTGDNVPARRSACRSARRAVSDDPAATPPTPPSAADRLVVLVPLFTGPLAEVEQAALRAWIDGAGSAAVWNSLEPHLRDDPGQVRSLIRRHPSRSRGGQPRRLPEKEDHAEAA